MTLNSKIILAFLKEHFGQELSKADIAAGAGVKEAAVMMTMRPHVKAGRATQRVEETTVVDEKGKEKVKNIYYYTLTEAGLAFDPEAYEAEKKAADAEKRRLAREAKKAAAAAEAE